jgi:hypothetical protein
MLPSLSSNLFLDAGIIPNFFVEIGIEILV